MQPRRSVPPQRTDGAEEPVSVAAPRAAAGLLVGRGTVLVALGAGIALVVVSLVWRLAEGAGWQPASQQLDRILDVDEDQSVLNWLSASLFLLSGLLAVQVARRSLGRDRLWWGVLAAGVLFVSLDEAAGAHDPVRVAVERAVSGGGLPLVAVVAVAAAAVPVGLAVLAALPRQLRWRAVLAVALVVVAAVGIDSLGPDLADAPERRLETWYVLKSSLEELLEVLAACLLLDTMVRAATPGARHGGSRPAARSGREHPAAEPLEQHQPETR